MELYIKQRVFAWDDTYDIYDETGEARYYVEAELFTFGHQIHVYDKRSGQELGSIHEHLFSWFKTFDIVINGQVMGTVRREFSFFTPRYTVDYRGWDVEGDFLEWDYRVLQGTMEIMSIEKKWLSWGDTYTLRYDNPANEMPGLLLLPTATIIRRELWRKSQALPSIISSWNRASMFPGRTKWEMRRSLPLTCALQIPMRSR